MLLYLKKLKRGIVPAYGRQGKTCFYSTFGGKEKIGRQIFQICQARSAKEPLFNKKLKILFAFQPPFDLIAKHRQSCEHRDAESGASEHTIDVQKSESLVWSKILDEARTFFENSV